MKTLPNPHVKKGTKGGKGNSNGIVVVIFVVRLIERDRESRDSF
jgi:hypothetical protein